MPDASTAQITRRFNRLRFIALLPVLAAAIWNSGQQYVLSLQAMDSVPAQQWRGRLADSMGFNLDENPVSNTLIAGVVMVGTVLLVATLVAGLVERLATLRSQRRFDVSVLYFALLFACLMPPAASPTHIVFGVTLGTFLGHTLFGGQGKSFLNPALVGVALTQVSFPTALTDHPVWTELNGYAGTRLFSLYQDEGHDLLTWLDVSWWDAFLGSTQGLIGTPSVLAALAGGLILVLCQLISWRLIVGQILGVVIVAGLFNLDGAGMTALPWYGHILLGSFAFSAVFIAADPSSAACTNAGRWLQGLLTGGLIVWIRVAHPSHSDSVIPVMLLTSMMAPLIDHCVIHLNMRRRMTLGAVARGRGEIHE